MLKRIFSGIMLILLLTGLLTFTTNFQQVNALYFEKDTTKSKEKHVTISFPMPQVENIGHYDWLRMENCSYFTTPGQPLLPVKNLVVKLPERSTVNNVSVEVTEALLPGSFSVLPAPSPCVVGSQEPESFSEDLEIYKSNSLFPKEWYVWREAHGIDAETDTRVKFLILNLFPLRFLPAQGEVTRAEEISIRVTYSESPSILAAPAGLENLIITSPTLEEYAVELAEWKNNTGISSKVLNTTWIYNHYSGADNQEKIRNCIKDFVTTHGIIYVTIFGDADQVPVRSVYVPDDYDTYTATDLYYADLDGTWDDNGDGLYGDQRYDDVDGIPDVYVGRIPPSLVEYAEVAVDKIKGYQQQFDASQDWTRRIVLAAGTGHNGVEDPFGIAFPFLKDYIANITTNKDVVKLYESAGNLSTTSMASEINKGALFVNFAGHGDPGTGLLAVGWLFYWVIPGLIWNGFGISDVQSLTNGFELPVVTTMSCSTARFDDTDCIGEWFVLEPDGGSIAYFGATRVAWSYVDGLSPYGLMGEMDRRIYESYYEGFTKLGQMWGQPVTKYVQSHIWNYETASVYDVKTFMEFVLLGDPTLGIRGNIYIRADGSVDPSTAPIQRDGNLYTLTANIYDHSIIVERDNIVIDGAGYSLQGTKLHSSKGILLDGRSNVTIRNMEITEFDDGICLYGSSNITISGNNITNNGHGIELYYSSENNTMSGNNIINNEYGIMLGWGSFNNTIVGNNVANNQVGVEVSGSANKTIIGNNMAENDLGVVLVVQPWGGPSYTPSYNNLVSENYIADNRYGVQVVGSCYNTILRNDITNNEYGVSLDWAPNVPYPGSYVYSHNNTIAENDIKASFFQSGIQLLNSSDNSVYGNNMVLDLGAGICLVSSSGNTISGNNITGYRGVAISLSSSDHNSILGNNIRGSDYKECYGILSDSSNYNTISENNITANGDGADICLCSSNHTIVSGSNVGIEGLVLWLYHSSYNSIFENNIGYEFMGFLPYFYESSNNIIYHNNFGNEVSSENSINVWDDGYPSGGNYWSDYADVDVYSGPSQTDPGSDGIWDHPYVIDADNQDRYPLVNPWFPIETCLVVRGLNNRIYYRTWNGTGWESWTVLPGSTIDSPAATICGNELHIVVRGSDGYSLWHGYVNLADNTFIGWTRLSGWTPSAPTLTSNGTVLCLVVRGGDNRIYYRTYSFSPRGWAGWNVIPTGTTCDGPAATMLGSDLHIVVRGFSATNVYGNYSMWHVIVEPNVGVVRGWISISGYTPSEPSLEANQTANELYLVVRGLDNRIYWRAYDGLPTDSWGSWNVVPTGSTCDGPAATVADNKLHFVVRGMDGSTLWHRCHDFLTATYSDWKRLSGATPSAPTLTG